jgi:hypothetical protein
MFKRVEIPDRLPVTVQHHDHVADDVHRKTAGIALRSRRIDLLNVRDHRAVTIGQRLNEIVVKIAQAARANRSVVGRRIFLNQATYAVWDWRVCRKQKFRPPVDS